MAKNSSIPNKLCLLYFFVDQITKKYVGFFIPEDGDALAMAHAFYEFLKKNGLEKVLLSLSLDGENKNTGTDRPSDIDCYYYCNIFYYFLSSYLTL